MNFNPLIHPAKVLLKVFQFHLESFQHTLLSNTISGDLTQNNIHDIQMQCPFICHSSNCISQYFKCRTTQLYLPSVAKIMKSSLSSSTKNFAHKSNVLQRELQICAINLSILTGYRNDFKRSSELLLLKLLILLHIERLVIM